MVTDIRAASVQILYFSEEIHHRTNHLVSTSFLSFPLTLQKIPSDVDLSFPNVGVPGGTTLPYLLPASVFAYTGIFASLVYISKDLPISF